MKRLILSVFTALTAITGTFGVNGCDKMADGTVITSQTAIVSDTLQQDFTIQDLNNLQDFLLAKPTQEDLNGKPYDLDGDGKWSVFDLCLMRQKVIATTEHHSDTLVAYFSRTGTTEVIADYIIDITGADVFEIEASVPYTDEDIQYSDSSCRANREQNDKSVRPKIKDTIENIEQYDTIFVGYPIWWNQEPRIIDTFLESYYFSGATVIPFCTSHSSGIGTSESNIKNLDVEYGELLSGKRFSASSTEKDVSEWLDTLPVSKKETETKMNIEVNGHTLTATLADNSSAKAFAELIKSEPLTIEMNDYGGFEKVGRLSENLPKNDEQITTEAGDIILYQGNQVTIYYDENTWNFTRLGKIDNITQTELKEILGTGSVSVTFSLERKTGVFDMESKTVMLNSGYEMPILGLGTYSLLDDTCVNSVVAELQSGGRLIDTAYMYHNEESVGKGIRQSGVPREEVFVETKLYPNQYADAENAIDEALEKLGVEYIDLMLLHHPGTNDVEAYKTMEQAVADGKIRSIGLSNWYIEELEDFLPQISIMPAVVQNEIHPYYQEIEVVPYIQSLGIVVQGWYPLGGRGYTAELLSDETIKKIAENHGVSSAQVILRWNLQRNVIVIPGSSNPDHIKENLDLFGFELSDNEMEQIKAINRDEKYDWY